MNYCKTCKNWVLLPDKEAGLVGSGVCQAAKPLWEVADYKGPNGYSELVLKPGHHGLLCFVQDGSNYVAEFVTMPDFGCVLHEMEG